VCKKEISKISRPTGHRQRSFRMRSMSSLLIALLSLLEEIKIISNQSNLVLTNTIVLYIVSCQSAPWVVLILQI
jgi:hypothetical protein